MDFGTISLNLDKGLYTSWKEFSNHVELVLKNCRQFNPPTTYPRQCADIVEKVWKKELAKSNEKKLAGMEKRSLQGLMTRLLKENEL
jgi:transcription initiation factor TFIID subunit 2